MSELFERRNLIGFLLKVAGLIVIAWGFVSGFIVLTDYKREYGYVPLIALTTFFTPILVGLLVIGFGELIDLVHKVVYGKNVDSSEFHHDENEQSIKPTIPFYAEQELTAFYTNQNEEITQISSTTERDVFKVDVNGRTEYVEVGGFTPKVLNVEEPE